MDRREALRLLMATSIAALVSCQKKFEETTEVIQENTSTSAMQSATPTETRTPEPTATEKTETRQATQTPELTDVPTVFMTRDISADGLLKIFQALDREPQGNVAVKISSGEPGGHYFLSPDLIAPLVSKVNGTIVECNTAYGGSRSSTPSHQQVMVDHGFTGIAPVDIMDAEATMELPIENGKHLTAAVVGSHFANYNFVVNLAHFKGHAMAGFGGVIKNMSIGISSKEGKCLVHTAGASSTSIWGGDQNAFLESMAEAAKGMSEYLEGNFVYINVMNNLSVDCDCDSQPAAPTMADIGILASLDPVAVDQACIDLVYTSPDGDDLIQRIESREGLHTLEYAATIGLGSQQYELVSID